MALTMTAISVTIGREGRTGWEGREEYCLTLTRLHADATLEQLDALRQALAVLAARYEKDAVCLHLEHREVVAAGVRQVRTR